MRKTDKKIENQLRHALTDVCNIALKEIEGFEWLTHRVNYNDFPNSLAIVCVFDSDHNLTAFISGNQKKELVDLIQKNIQAILAAYPSYLKKLADYIVYDSEESCLREHEGNWAKRISTY